MSTKNIVWFFFAALVVFNIFLFGKCARLEHDLNEYKEIMKDPKRTENFLTTEDIERFRRETDMKLDNICREMKESEERLQSNLTPQLPAGEMESSFQNVIQGLELRIQGVERDIDNIYNSTNSLEKDINRLNNKL